MKPFFIATIWTGPVSTRAITSPSPPLLAEKAVEKPNIIVRALFNFLFGKN